MCGQNLEKNCAYDSCSLQYAIMVIFHLFICHCNYIIDNVVSFNQAEYN